MKKEFIPAGSIPKSIMLETKEVHKFLYGRVKELSNRHNLHIGGDNLLVGKEYFIVSNGCKTVIPVLVIGYELVADLITYDNAEGIVGCEERIILMDEEGNRYKEGDYCTINKSREEAEEIRLEMLEDIDDE